MPLPRDPALAEEGARKTDFARRRPPVPRAPAAGNAPPATPGAYGITPERTGT